MGRTLRDIELGIELEKKVGYEKLHDMPDEERKQIEENLREVGR